MTLSHPRHTQPGYLERIDHLARHLETGSSAMTSWARRNLTPEEIESMNAMFGTKTGDRDE